MVGRYHCISMFYEYLITIGQQCFTMFTCHLCLCLVITNYYTDLKYVLEGSISAWCKSKSIDNPLLLKMLYYYPWTSIKTLYRIQCSAVVCGVMRTQCTSPGAPVRVSLLTVSPKASSLLQLPPAALWLRCTAGPGDKEPPSSPTADPSACSALKQVLETGAMFSALFAFSLHCMTQSVVGILISICICL